MPRRLLLATLVVVLGVQVGALALLLLGRP